MKTFVVVTKPVKNSSAGIIARERYLKSESHPNHTNTEAIFDVVGNEATSKRIIVAGEQYKLNKMLSNNRRGRQVRSFAMEFCLSLPQGYRPTKEQWRSIAIDCCKALADHLKLTGSDRKEFYSLVRGVCHQQKQTGTKGGDHLHLIFSKLVRNRVLRELQRKGATALLKQAFTTAVSTHVGISIDDYKPHQLNRGRRLEKWQYESRKLEKAQEQRDLVLKKLEKQIEKWELALESLDTKQMRRQRNRIEKTFSELGEELENSDISSRISDILK
ncbi:hypothetical protein BCU85_19270 [Vibrio lentus]|uniref:hypothetical protein n=1 Tax=Vibrio lentus TaxID=136468 RepID=UPI000C8414FD|nr:hypothetical protein [Vibrio lentus]MCC4815453.1 hypothetical protein [Vibrio lentus]PMG72681.1 hypothetical protein BCU85_19270 [Vibrio lentus]PMK91594.1 hypothetical protein BCT88_04965 [Vibrio lentus]PML22616.1 hypothetical protein BCT80_11670 [Vibrio lentus]PMM26862.1 hypothetical protein BCT57_19865 [Vibrio lentus]